MHRLRTFGVIVLTTLALSAVFEGSASASKLVLRSEKGGEVLKFGAILRAGVFPRRRMCRVWVLQTCHEHR